VSSPLVVTVSWTSTVCDPENLYGYVSYKELGVHKTAGGLTLIDKKPCPASGESRDCQFCP